MPLARDEGAEQRMAGWVCSSEWSMRGAQTVYWLASGWPIFSCNLNPKILTNLDDGRSLFPLVSPSVHVKHLRERRTRSVEKGKCRRLRFSVSFASVPSVRERFGSSATYCAISKCISVSGDRVSWGSCTKRSRLLLL